jgi:hypothetical protein
MSKITHDVIKKEEILNLHPAEKDVLVKKEMQAHRKACLTEALQNASKYYKKATVLVQTDEGIKQITATIWAMTEKYIVFKGGITVPICSILDVQLH